MKRSKDFYLFVACTMAGWFYPVSAAAASGFLGVEGLVAKIGQPAERKIESGMDSLYWKRDHLVVHAYAEDGGKICTLLIAASDLREAPTVTQVLEQVEKFCPEQKWQESLDNPDAKKGGRRFVSGDGRLECIVFRSQDGETFGYFAFVGDLAFKERANQRSEGTSAKVPPSNPSQGAAVPHP